MRYWASATAEAAQPGVDVHCGWVAQVVRALELEEGEASGRASGGGSRVAGGAVSRVLGLGDAAARGLWSQSCSRVSSGPNFVGIGESTSSPLSQWYLLDTEESGAVLVDRLAEGVVRLVAGVRRGWSRRGLAADCGWRWSLRDVTRQCSLGMRLGSSMHCSGRVRLRVVRTRV